MTNKLIKEIVELVRQHWRPYQASPDSPLYAKLDCLYVDAKKGDKWPIWFARGDVFICLGCGKRCCVSRPEGMLMPLPIKYSEPPEKFDLTPMQMVKRKHLLTIREAAYCLNIAERTVYLRIAEGKLRKTVERPVRVLAEDVLAEMNGLDMD